MLDKESCISLHTMQSRRHDTVAKLGFFKHLKQTPSLRITSKYFKIISFEKLY